MPIKPENRHRYPANWSEIRAAILARAGEKCEKCGAPNRTRIARGAGKDADTYMLASADVFCADTGEHLGQRRHSDYELLRMTDVVLTIAHLDHVPENCAPENLRAWCQRCHLRHDQAHHQATARATRRARLGNLELAFADGVTACRAKQTGPKEWVCDCEQVQPDCKPSIAAAAVVDFPPGDARGVADTEGGQHG